MKVGDTTETPERGPHENPLTPTRGLVAQQGRRLAEAEGHLPTFRASCPDIRGGEVSEEALVGGGEVASFDSGERMAEEEE